MVRIFCISSSADILSPTQINESKKMKIRQKSIMYIMIGYQNRCENALFEHHHHPGETRFALFKHVEVLINKNCC